MKYQVTTLDAANVLSTEIIEARDEQTVRARCDLKGLKVAAIKISRRSLLAPRNESQRRSAHHSLILFSQELLALLNAGLSITESMEALIEKETDTKLYGTLSDVLTSLREGQRLSSALEENGDFFPSLYVGLIKAAENTGELPNVLRRYIDYRQRLDLVRNKIISSAIYPLILAFVGGIVTLFLIGYVVPRFAEVYQSAGRDLPWMSQLLLNWGQFFSNHTKGALITFFILLILVFSSYRIIGAFLIRTLLAYFPSLAEKVKIYELARSYLTLGMLLDGGISLGKALEILANASTSNLKIKLNYARKEIESGMSCSSAFHAQGLTTSISLRMLRVGEKTGQLGGMLTQSANFYEAEINRWLDRFIKSFEPLLMAAIGLVVGTIVVLLYLPIFDLVGNLQ